MNSQPEEHPGGTAGQTVGYMYADWREHPDPPHQPLYLDIVLRRLRSEPTVRRVLDAGCGNGNFTASVAAEGFEMFGIDLSPSGIEVASAAYPGVRFQQASVYDDLSVVFPEAPAFDACVSVEVIEHLYDPRTFVRRVHGVLRPGGIFVVTTPYWGYLKNLALAVTNRVDSALTALWDGGHIKHWSRRTLTELLLEQPFDVVGFDGAGRPIPGLWNGMVMTVRKV